MYVTSPFYGQPGQDALGIRRADGSTAQVEWPAEKLGLECVEPLQNDAIRIGISSKNWCTYIYIYYMYVYMYI